jgi:hypothetical protein
VTFRQTFVRRCHGGNCRGKNVNNTLASVIVALLDKTAEAPDQCLSVEPTVNRFFLDKST